MSAFLTYGEAKARFQNLVTTEVSIEDAIQEVVTRAFELGRFPEMKEEVMILNDQFFVDDNGHWYVDFDPDKYDGALGFRTEGQGYQIVADTALYNVGVPAGGDSFIDFGIVDKNGTNVRRYRMPGCLNYDFNDAELFALMKLRPPELRLDTDVVPIRPWGALKAGIMAVAYENVNDMERAQLNWQRFYDMMSRDQRQYEGPKRYIWGFNGNTKYKPTTFM